MDGTNDRLRVDDFGEDFVWGVASAAFQIEGAWDTDGKPPSVWDTAGDRGRIAGGDVGRVAIDAYHRYGEDLALVQSLGFRANRFSISWPRVFGEGRGPWNDAGGAYYDRVIDEGLERGLEPWATVHHWDMPQALADKGAWARREIVDEFAEFAAQCAEHYGDRVTKWMVFNEPLSVIGHTFAGVHTSYRPHLRETLASIHHINLACAEAGRRMRAILGPDAQIGTTNVFTLSSPYDADDPKMRKAQRAYDALLMRVFLDPPAGLGYPFADAPLLRGMRKYILDGDLDAVRFEYDFMGVQYYGPTPISAKSIPGLGFLPKLRLNTAEVAIKSGVGISVEPSGMLEVLRRYADHPACKRFVITENGFGGKDRLVGDRVRDDVRIWYLRSHLAMVRQAIAEGIPIDGYFHWSYSDNIEWLFGRDVRFGLIYIDYDKDYRRVLKDSAKWFQRFLSDPEGVD